MTIEIVKERKEATEKKKRGMSLKMPAGNFSSFGRKIEKLGVADHSRTITVSIEERKKK